MLTLEMLEKMLLAAAVELEEKSKMLCELDSVAGDGDHGVTIARMAESMKNKVEAHDSSNIKDLLDDLSMAFMNSNGGSAGPLWGTVFGGLADAAPEDAKEVSLEELLAMLAQAKEDFEGISKAKIGDKTMVDALYPALEAGMVAEGDAKTVFAAMGKAAAEGAEKTADMVARFGRAKNVGERSLGTKDPGATSISILLTAMAAAI